MTIHVELPRTLHRELRTGGKNFKIGRGYRAPSGEARRGMANWWVSFLLNRLTLVVLPIRCCPDHLHLPDPLAGGCRVNVQFSRTV